MSNKSTGTPAARAGQKQITTWVPARIYTALRVAVVEDDLRLGAVIAQLIEGWLAQRQAGKE